MFTVDPVTRPQGPHGGRGRARRSARHVVSGEVTPDNYTLSRKGVRQEVARSSTPNGCSPTTECAALARMGLQLAELNGAPQDIEWAFDAAGDLYMLQSRPITTI